jgi:hypothetical protein
MLYHVHSLTTVGHSDITPMEIQNQCAQWKCDGGEYQSHVIEK